MKSILNEIVFFWVRLKISKDKFDWYRISEPFLQYVPRDLIWSIKLDEERYFKNKAIIPTTR